MEVLDFSELIERITEKLADFSSEELQDIAINILDRGVQYKGDGVFEVTLLDN